MKSVPSRGSGWPDRFVSVELGLLLRFRQITYRHSAIRNPPDPTRYPRGGTDFISPDSMVHPALSRSVLYSCARLLRALR